MRPPKRVGKCLGSRESHQRFQPWRRRSQWTLLDLASKLALPMALAPLPATAQPAELEPAPLLLPWDLRLSPEQFERVCESNPAAVLELAADGTLIAMTPTGGETGARSLRLGHRLQSGTEGPGAGAWIAFDSSTGFRLADGSVLSPDVSLVRKDRSQALPPEQRRGFPPLCPDQVVELASPNGARASDEGPRGVSALRRKMEV